MIAPRSQGQAGEVVAKFEVPGVDAFRVTIQPSPAGWAWSADACVLLSAADATQPPPREAPAAGGHDTHALDELFARGL